MILKNNKIFIRSTNYLIIIAVILISILMIIIVLILLLNYFRIHNYTVTRDDKIPITAEWHGGDGGHWFNLTDRKDSIVTFEIYNDRGVKLIQAEYTLDCGCVKIDTVLNQIHKYIIGLDSDEIDINIACNNQYCRLKLRKYLFKYKG